jgi:hypothetical protein
VSDEHDDDDFAPIPKNPLLLDDEQLCVIVSLQKWQFLVSRVNSARVFIVVFPDDVLPLLLLPMPEPPKTPPAIIAIPIGAPAPVAISAAPAAIPSPAVTAPAAALLLPSPLLSLLIVMESDPDPPFNKSDIFAPRPNSIIIAVGGIRSVSASALPPPPFPVPI